MNEADKDIQSLLLVLPSECIQAAGDHKHTEVKRENRTAGTLKTISLRHPYAGQPATFLYNRTDKLLYEINIQKDKYSSWFVNSEVQMDGSLHVPTRFDPLFTILPYLSQNAKVQKFVLLDQILKDDQCPDCHILSECLSSEQLQNIADCSGSGDIIGYKYNQEKTLSWLASKVRAVASSVKDAGLFIGGPEDTEYSSVKENIDGDLLEYAFGVLSSYLDGNISDLLQKHLNIRKRADKRRSMDHGDNLQTKKAKSEDVLKDKIKKPPKMTKAQRELSKVNKKGMKNISSFFSPSSKK